MPQTQDGLANKVRAKFLKLWARFSDDESAEISHAQEELAAEQGRSVTRAEARDEVCERGSNDAYRHPVDRPDFEPPGSYPPSHRRLNKKDRGPHGVQ